MSNIFLLVKMLVHLNVYKLMKEYKIRRSLFLDFESRSAIEYEGYRYNPIGYS